MGKNQPVILGSSFLGPDRFWPPCGAGHTNPGSTQRRRRVQGHLNRGKAAGGGSRAIHNQEKDVDTVMTFPLLCLLKTALVELSQTSSACGTHRAGALWGQTLKLAGAEGPQWPSVSCTHPQGQGGLQSHLLPSFVSHKCITSHFVSQDSQKKG